MALLLEDIDLSLFLCVYVWGVCVGVCVYGEYTQNI